MRPHLVDRLSPTRARRRVGATAALLSVVALVVAAVLFLRPAPTDAGAASPGSDRLTTGEHLADGQQRATSTGSHRLTMEADGDVVLYAGAKELWSTGTSGNPHAELVLASTGALEVRAADGTVLWSNDVELPGARLVVKPGGYLAEISPAGRSVWSSKTAPTAAAAVAASDRVPTGEELVGDEAIGTSDGSHRLVMQTDGDAVLYAGTRALWSTDTAGNPGALLRMGTDGNLTVVSARGAVLWSNGAGSPGARLVVKGDGRLYEIAKAGEEVWSSASGSASATTGRAPSYLVGAGPYVNPDSPAARGARKARTEGRASDAALLEKAAAEGSSRWLTTADGVGTVERTVRTYADAARAAGQTPVFVTYAIPDRDCGNKSAGGFSAAAYPQWSAAVARGLEGTRSVVIVEPDSLLHVYKCGDSDERFGLLEQASAAYAAAGAEVYLDGGSSNSFGGTPASIADMASRLSAAGVARVAGFATNVSNFQTTADERAYGRDLSALLGGARYVIDTSRNGNGAVRDAHGTVWCNPPGRALGERPGATADGAHVANLWVKTVGRSDGACRGTPAAGAYWEANLLELAKNAQG